MGNGIGRLNLCFAGDAGDISRRRHHHDIAVYLSDPLVDNGLGHSFCYIGPDPSSKLDRTISGASISANTSTPLSTALMIRELCPCNSFDKAASFESSDSFASIPLQPIPKNSVRSGPIPSGLYNNLLNSGPMAATERGFLSGPLEVQNYHYDQLQRYKPKSKKLALMKILRRRKDKDKSSSPRQQQHHQPAWMVNGSDHQNRPLEINNLSLSSTEAMSIAEHREEEEDYHDDNEQNLHHPLVSAVQWAQGKAGEDRVHVVISEEYGWDFVGIYDGFNGPDATDFLLNNLYSNVHKELKGISSNPDHRHDRKDDDDNEKSPSSYHTEVLRALSEALKKTERAYLEIANVMLDENPELALMGSCVLAMLMKGEDVYLMNVGDSRAVLARKPEHFNGNELVDAFPSFDTFQITVDHSTSVDEEVRRIKSEHRDDPCSVINGRVKGSLKVTRAFGAGFLKQPKWNNALLEMFRIDYVGTCPYITCSPSLYHHKLSPRDKFLILSSDGLYQYFTNEEAVAEVEVFIASFPEGDPAQHLVEEVLFRAAKKAGMDFHELLDIPQGDRRKYHDDVSVIIISFEGRIWRSSL